MSGQKDHFILRDQNWKINTPERHLEHSVGYISLVITYSDRTVAILVGHTGRKTCVQLKL